MKLQSRTSLVPVGALALALWTGSATAALAQEPARLQLPAFDTLAQKASESVDVTLDAALLQLAAGFLRDDDETDVKQLLQDIRGIYVKSFEFDRDGAYSTSDVDAVRAQLGRGNWTRLVDVKSAREASHSEVYVWMERGAPGGLAIVSTEPRELTIVNIVGRVDLEKLRKLEGQFGIPRMDVGGEKPPKD
jgi:Domain of unknown function (DUF4252)